MMPTWNSVSATVLAAVVSFGVSAEAASAQTLFDMLFGGKRIRQVERERPAPPPKPKPVALPKVSAPSFYNYKPETLSKVDFAPVLAAEAPPPSEFARPGSSFGESRAGLEGFELYAEKDVAAAMAAHYAENPDFIWVDGYHPNARAAEALQVLSEAEQWGLQSSDYSMSLPPAGFSLDDVPARMADLMHFEMALTARVLRYARDANGGRVDPNKLSGYYDFEPKTLNLVAALKTLANTSAVRSFLELRHPGNKQFASLKNELAALRKSAEDEIVVDAKTFVKPGGKHAELPKIIELLTRQADEAYRAEFGDLLAARAGSEDYVEELVPAIKAAQKARGLQADGIIGPRTVAAISGESKADRIEKVLVAMEQLRWHPEEFGPRNVTINAASFTATYTEDDKPRLSMRVVVGKPSNQTSFFHDEIEYVEFNPFWGVPRSILINEMLPRLRNDPGYLDRAGYQVTDSRGRRVSSSSIDWGRYGANIPFDVRQEPSERNALGELKIMFPNKHAIYMHDTPAKSLFSRDMRAYSHGCVRLQDPRAMAAAVMGWDESQIVARLKKGHNQVELPSKIPVYVTYFTAWPDAEGKVAYYPDVYGRDKRVETAMEKTSDMRAPSS